MCVKRFIKRSAPSLLSALPARMSSGSRAAAPHTRSRRMHHAAVSDATEWKPYLYQGRARTHGPPRRRAQRNSPARCPTHTPSHAKQGPELNEGDPGWPHPPAHKMHPPAHASAPAAVRPQSQRARPSLLRQHESPPQITSVQRSPSLLHPSGPRRQSQQPIPLTSLWSSKAEPAAHPSYIPLAPEGRASADSQAYASYCIRLSSQ